MKKLLVLASLILSISLVSCSNDDDEGQDPIIGLWKIESVVIEGQTIPLEDCDEEQTIRFESNGDVTATYYILNENDGCDIDEVAEGTWDLIEGTNYEVTLGGESSILDITFSNNNNKFSISQTTTDEETVYTTTVTYAKQ